MVDRAAVGVCVDVRLGVDGLEEGDDRDQLGVYAVAFGRRLDLRGVGGETLAPGDRELLAGDEE